MKSIGLGTVRIEVPGIYRDYSTGDMSLNELWMTIKRPFPAHVRQIMLYMRALGVHNCIAYYQNKWDQGQKAFHVRYLPKAIAPLIEQMEMVVDNLANDRVVRRPEWAHDETVKTCRECQYRVTCWRLEDGDVDADVQEGGGGAVPLRLFTRVR